MILAAAGCFTYWFGFAREILPPPNAGLVVEAKELDFGEAWEVQEFPWRLTIHNPTGKDVKIDDWFHTCNCVSIEPKTLRILPGEIATAKLTLNLLDDSPSAEGKLRRDFDVGIVPLIEGKYLGQRGWTITGKIRRILSTSPTRLFVTEELIRGTAYAQQEIRVKAHTLLHSIKPTCKVASVGIRLGSTSNDFIVGMNFYDWLSAGRHRTELILEALGSDLKPIGRTVLPVEVLVVEPVMAMPGAIIVGASAFGDVHEETIVLMSRFKEPFIVSGVKSSSANIVVEALASRLHEYRVRVTANARKGQPDSIEFLVECAERRFRIAVPVYGTAIQKPDTQCSENPNQEGDSQ